MSEQKNNPPPQELAIPDTENTGSVEYDLPYVELPKGEKTKNPYSGGYDYGRVPEETIKEFFTPEMISRLVYCPNINIDLMDDWGVSGFEPGFIFVEKSNYKGTKTLNDEIMLNGGTFDMITTESGVEIAALKKGYFEDFPRNKFYFEVISPSSHPEMFTYLRKALNHVDSDDLSTYPTEDINNIYNNLHRDQIYKEEQINELARFKKLRSKFDTPIPPEIAVLEKLEKESPKKASFFSKIIRKMHENDTYNQPPLNLPPAEESDFNVPYDVDNLGEFIEQKSMLLQKLEQESPEKTLKRLEIVEEIQRRGLNPNRNFFPSFKEEEESINKDIKKAKLVGDNELAEKISTTFNRVKPLLEAKSNVKQISESSN